MSKAGETSGALRSHSGLLATCAPARPHVCARTPRRPRPGGLWSPSGEGAVWHERGAFGMKFLAFLSPLARPPSMPSRVLPSPDARVLSSRTRSSSAEQCVRIAAAGSDCPTRWAGGALLASETDLDVELVDLGKEALDGLLALAVVQQHQLHVCAGRCFYGAAEGGKVRCEMWRR